MALKMFVTDQLYLLKQSVGSPKTSECNCNYSDNSNNIHVNSLIEQMEEFLKEENKMKNSIIQSLVQKRPSNTIHDNLPENISKSDPSKSLNKGDISSPNPNDDNEFDEYEEYNNDKYNEDVVLKNNKRRLDENVTNRKKKKKQKKKLIKLKIKVKKIKWKN